jgi:hypothetical protein
MKLVGRGGAVAISLCSCLWFIAFAGIASVDSTVKILAPAGRRVIEPFDYRGVTLEPGPLQKQVDEVRRFYLAIPDDDLLKGFRARAGLPAPGKDLGGWYSSDTFLVFGQIVSGLARLYASTGDVACRDKANRLLLEWAKCIEPDGYFYASRKPNAPHYIYDKMLWGLLDDYLYCGNQDALKSLSRITDWAIKNLDRSRRVNDTSTEWYTLSENLYRAYLVTGDAKYRQFAEVWEYHDYWDLFARGGNPFGPRPDGTRSEVYHAYSHVNNLGGAAAAYLVKGDAVYLETIKKAYDYLQTEQCFATGGFGPDEELLPRDKLREKLLATHHTFETQCGTWAAFKLSKYLITFTGDARYGDWVERLLYNGIGASIPMTADGRVFYYSDYCPHGGEKRNTDFGWSCCTGTRPQAMADCDDLIYFHDERSLYVNLFVPSLVRWSREGNPVTLIQDTRFPENDLARLTVQLQKPEQFAINFRVPGWLSGPMRVTVNGHKADCVLDSAHWASLSRRWKNGDEIQVRLPMKVWASPLFRDQSTPVAAMCGPVVLAFTAPKAKLLRDVNPVNLDQVLIPEQDHPLTFSLVNQSVKAWPFYELTSGERYFLYLDRTMGNRIPHQDVKFSGQWNESGAFRFSNEVGAVAECEFEGTGVRWLGWRFDDAGRAEVRIDGAVAGVVDQYGPGRELPFDWSFRGLSPGRHVINLRVLQEKSDSSTNRYLNVRGFEVIENSR